MSDKDIKINIGAKLDEASVTSTVNKIKQQVSGVANRGGGTPQQRQRKLATSRKQQNRKQQRFTKDNLKALRKELAIQKELTKEKKKQAELDRAKVSLARRAARGAARGITRGASKFGRYAGGQLAKAPEAAVGGLAQAGTAIASRLMSFMRSQITSGYASYLSAGRARAGLSGMGRISEGTLLSGQAQGYSVTDTIQQAQGMGRATGQLSPVIKAQQIARSYGGSVSDVTSMFGTLTRSGQGFGGKAGHGGDRQMQTILANAFKSGLDKSRAGEFFQSVSSGIRSAQNATSGAVDATKISGLLSFFSRSKQSGLQGARGFKTLSTIDSTIKGAGRLAANSEIVNTMLMQSQGFGVPGGHTDYLTAKANLDQGIFGEGGAGNLVKMANRLRQTGADKRTQAGMLSAMTQGQLNQKVAGSVLGVVNGGGSPEEVLKQIAAITKEQKPINERLLDNSDDSLIVAKRVAGLENRLYLIGQKSAKSIESIQDAMLEVADALMPTALTVLQGIASSIRFIVDLLRPILSALPGGANDQMAAKAVSASNDAAQFVSLFGGRKGISKISDTNRSNFTNQVGGGIRSMQTVLDANKQGVIKLDPFKLADYQRELEIAQSEQRLATSGAPMSMIGNSATSSTLRRRLSSDNRANHPIDLGSSRVHRMEESTLRNEYGRTHDYAAMPQDVYNQAFAALMVKLNGIEDRSDRMHSLLDVGVYRAIVADVTDTAQPTGRVE